MSAILRCVLLCAVFSGCAEVRESDRLTQFEMVGAPAGVSTYYDRDVQSLFNRSCTGGCHEPGGTGVRDSGLDLTTGESYAGMLDPTRSKNGPHVVIGDPDNSLLVWKLEGVDPAGRRVYGDVMPFGRSPLSPEEIARVRTWISEGAQWSVAPPAPPRVLSLGALDSSTVELRFDKDLDPNSAADVGNYVVRSDEGSLLSVAAVLLDGPAIVLLTVSPSLAAGATLTVESVGLKGLDGLLVSEAILGTFRFTPVVSYAEQIQPVLDQSCAFVGCHSASDVFPPGAGLILDAGVSRAQLVGVPSGQLAGGVRVVVGNPEGSYLISKIEGETAGGDRMPVGGPFLTSAQTQAFRLWIEQGASDN
jgi:hypothetical protein